MRLAIAGLGFIGSVHLKALRSVPGVQLAAVITGDEKKLAGDLSRSQGNLPGAEERFDFSGIKKYRKLREALTDPEIDAVDLCVPTDLHELAAVEALRAGKHVLVEKPMALGIAASERMIEEARRAERALMVGHVLRFFPAYRALIGAMKDLGEPRSATFRRRCAQPTWAEWQSDPARSGGAVLDLLIHDLDFALHLFGPPKSVSAGGRDERDIDLVSAQLFYPGFTVDVTGGWHPGKFPLSMKYRVVGSEASVEFNYNEYAPRMHRGEIVRDLPLESTDGFAAEIAYFADCVRKGSQPERCRPEESADAVRLALLIQESRNQNGERIAWKSA
jgi:predicted dehydrogenase